MAASSGSALALAARLRALDDEALSRLVTLRHVREHGIRDFFDLSEALLDRGSVQAALARLDRPTLALLAVAGDQGTPTAAQLAERLGSPLDEVIRRAETAVDAALLGEESGRYAPWDAVVEQLRAWPAFGLPSVEQLVSEPAPAALEPVSESDARFVDRGAGDRAFAAVTAVTELLHAVRIEPARQLSRGGIALPDARRLAAAAAIDAEQLDAYLDIASRAGLARLDGAGWVPSETSDAWLGRSRIDRWEELARAWFDRLPDDLRQLLRQRARAVWGDGLLDFVAWLYPAGADWIRDRVTAVAHEAELLGLTGGSTPSTPGAALLTAGPDAAAAAMGALFPPEVDRIYVQPDLSIVAPGPLAAELDGRLRRIAEAENVGLASTYRVTAVSLTRALIAGETVESIRAFVEGLSLTGIPQPLDYLLNDTAAHFGSLRVGELDPGTADGAASYVTARDATSLEPLLVDPALGALRLEPVARDKLVSRAERAVVYWTLTDAHYPAVAEDADGEVLELVRDRRAVAGGASNEDTAAILVARVRSGAAAEPAEAGQAWLARQLESAAKNKIAVLVGVRLPDGSEVQYLLEPASLAGGRLRARDRRADIERTLPLSSITAVQPL